MLWTPIALASVLLSWLGTALLARKLFVDWDVRVSCVRALFLLFFAYLWLYSTARAAYYLYLLALPPDAFVDIRSAAAGMEPLSYAQLDRLGIHAIMHIRARTNPGVVTVLLLGDTAHFGVAVWTFPLVYELSLIVRKSMDRGAAKESERMRVYFRSGHVAIALFAAVDVVLALAASGLGYTQENHDCLLFVYVVHILTLVYMIAMLASLKFNGRKYESIQGEFVASPVYQRLKRIMLVYAVFSIQFQVASLVIYSTDNRDPTMLTFIGVSLALYNATGFVLSVTTGCSQTCVLTYCSVCIPDDIEAQLIHGGPLQYATPASTPFADSNSHHLHNLESAGNPPSIDPVFVFTDIEASSALWAIGDGQVMKRATELHDSILRGLLAKYRGYEITTAGDAFQLAFHTVREATSYCLDAQIQLVVAKWPKELHGMVPATERKHVNGVRLIFNGLRVRMGIHDAAESDGTLVHSTHAVTGKMTYTGASEVIANEVGDLGSGGQILVTKRVARWLLASEALVDIPYRVERVGTHVIPQVNGHLEVYQVVPQLFVKRMKYFGSILKRSETVSSMHVDRIHRGSSMPRMPFSSPTTPLYTLPLPRSPPQQVDTTQRDDEYRLVDSARSQLAPLALDARTHSGRERTSM
ncbi:hypothetical protein PybrP1_006474 [[Pythium] brassicae (nom. inval.)]|nr:hypothetical protein PybrP1_006474 [[Pythium] brassicae (nom. inval.)]